jgi:hypothetical protein
MSTAPMAITAVGTTESARIEEERKSIFVKEKDLGLKSPDTFDSTMEKPTAPGYVDGEEQFTAPVESPKDIVTEVIHAEDDPDLNPWTFRTWFVGEYFYRTGKVVSYRQ